MALPVLQTPKFELTLPSTKKKYKYRPFLAKEEKILLIALEGGEEKEIVNSIKEIIRVCVDGLDVDTLPIFDLEYVFLQLRAKSIGDKITFYVKHAEVNSECENRQEVEVDLNEVTIFFDEKHTNKIQLDKSTGLVMKYPSLDLAQEIEEMSENNPASVFNMIKKCVDYIYDAENVYADFTDKELEGFIDSMSHAQLEKINEFFVTIPKLRHELTWKCDKCGKEETIVIEGLSNFFT